MSGQIIVEIMTLDPSRYVLKAYTRIAILVAHCLFKPSLDMNWFVLLCRFCPALNYLDVVQRFPFWHIFIVVRKVDSLTPHALVKIGFVPHDFHAPLLHLAWLSSFRCAHVYIFPSLYGRLYSGYMYPMETIANIGMVDV